MSYTDVFGGSTIYPSQVSYLAIALTEDVALEWPTESAGVEYPAARIIDVTPDVSDWAITLPDATQAGPGQTILFNNLDGAESFFVKDFDGNTLATVDFGEQWQVYLADNSDAAGTWRVYRFGASIASVQPSSLAGPGLTVVGSTLGQSSPVTTFSSSGSTVSVVNRAGTLVWTGTGSGTLNLPAAATAGNNFFVGVRNEGGGDLTIDAAGSETINGDTTLVMRPGDSAILNTDGAAWYTVGLGQQPVFAFDYTSITINTGTYTLSGSELNRVAYKFVGVLAGDVDIVVPSTIQQYWINNATTGAFDVTIQTAGGTPVTVNQGAKGIYYCDGSDLVLASDPTSLASPIGISDGGTGATTASAARLSLGITLFADSIVTATTGATVRSTIGAAASGANNDITSMTGLTTPLTVPQGGTGAATLTGYVKGAGAAALTASATIPFTDVTGTVPVTQGGTGAVTLTGYVKGAGTSALTASATIPFSDITGTVGVAQGGTGLTSYAVGDLVYASGATTLAKLADVATGNALISGGVTTAPAWGKIGLTTHVSGVLPVANGGTNASVAGIAAFNNITGYTASGATGTTSTNLVFSTSPTLTTPTLTTPTINSGMTVNGGATINGGLTLGTVLAIAQGGTGASDVAGILTALGFAASGDATSGHCDIPFGAFGTLRINWGTTSVGGNTSTTASMHANFSTAFGGTGSMWDTNTGLTDNWFVGNVTTSTIGLTNGDNFSHTFNWIAWGLA